MAGTFEFVYVTYIRSDPEKIWTALTDPGQTAAFWGHSNVSDWQVGSGWEHQRTDGSRTPDVVGTVVESAPPTRLVTTWAEPGVGPEVKPSRVTFGIEPYGEIVRLTVTHQDLADEAERDATAGGWAAVLSNLKTFIETGRPLPQEPWTMP
ncbi:SRPBCC family protein [Streptomyces sp. NPDC057654]|uniref:SRPBCC family protein n=1 Tax=Streptomyces sp. NPDC057654 TaxID=3346196 RepID=UPI0036938AC2